MSAHYYDVLAAVLSVLVDLTATTIHTEQLTHLIYLSLCACQHRWIPMLFI